MKRASLKDDDSEKELTEKDMLEKDTFINKSTVKGAILGKDYFEKNISEN